MAERSGSRRQFWSARGSRTESDTPHQVTLVQPDKIGPHAQQVERIARIELDSVDLTRMAAEQFTGLTSMRLARVATFVAMLWLVFVRGDSKRPLRSVDSCRVSGLTQLDCCSWLL